MSNFKIGCKTATILTAVYGWFIPFTLMPSFSQQADIQIEEEFPQVFQMDIDSLFDFEEETIENDVLEPKEDDEVITPITPQKKFEKELPKSVKEEPLPQQTNTPLKERLVSAPSSMHPLQNAHKKKTTRNAKRRTKRCTSTNPDITLLSKSSSQREYSLPKSLIKYYSKNWKEANHLANLAWSTNKQGDVRGIKIRQIYCKSPLRYSGLKKGDIVLSVNGTKLNSSSRLLQLIPKIRFWQKIELDIIREGKPLTLEYNVMK